MSKSYQQLTEDERIDINAMRQAGKTVSQMAEALGRNQSTLYREVNRNSGQLGYRPKQTHANRRYYFKGPRGTGSSRENYLT